MELGPQVVVVKQGEYGSAMYTPEGVFGLPAYPTADVVDPTGAGDTFNAALAVARNEGLDLPAAIDFAQRAAAISVTRAGAMASMPRRASASGSPTSAQRSSRTSTSTSITGVPRDLPGSMRRRP